MAALETAARLGELPAVDAAMRAGELSAVQANEIGGRCRGSLRQRGRRRTHARRAGTGPPLAGRDRPPARARPRCAVLSLGDGAVATSGTAERGAHVFDPHTGRAALDLASVTVLGPDL